MVYDKYNTFENKKRTNWRKILKFCAIICEFNPLHNGHKYLIEQAKAKTGLPVICLMSGNFCQRSMPCFFDKYTRAKHAILSGADIVLELPTVFATGSANTFAKGAISILSQLPVSHLVFGSECGNLEKLISAKEFCKSLDENNAVKNRLDSGLNYKSAIYEATKEKSDKMFDVISKPNNALAIEYLRSLEGTDIVPVTIRREDNYLDGGKQFLSSSTIRESVNNNTIEGILDFVPEYVANDIENHKDSKIIDEHLFFALKTAKKEKLATLFSVSEGLENRIAKVAAESKNYDEFLEKCVTKRYSKIRIRRIALENIFGITKEVAKSCFDAVPTTILLAKSPALNFDGFFEKKINLVLKKSDKKRFETEKMLEIDMLAEKLYER